MAACSKPSSITASSDARAPIAASAAQSASAIRVRHALILRGGTIYDGSGGPARVGDVAVDGERIVAVGNLAGASAAREIDATGLSVAPGFVNCLSWTADDVADTGGPDLKQGVTLEVYGEGLSIGPYPPPSAFTTFGKYLDLLKGRGLVLNWASFVGATTVRQYVLGDAKRPATAAELARMQDLVREAMLEGALGVSSALIYAPAIHAQADELTALASAAAESQGSYISHLRSEGDHLLEAVDELIEIARETHAHAEIYHLKSAGVANWPKWLVPSRVSSVLAPKACRSVPTCTHTRRRRPRSSAASIPSFNNGVSCPHSCRIPWCVREPRARCAGHIRTGKTSVT
jgi:N-acyl-D-amino-acid deacylase